MGPHARRHARGRQAQAVHLGRPHLDELAAPVHQGREGHGVGAGQRPDLGADGLGEVGQYRRVEGVGLGQPAGGPGEVAHLPRVDDGHRPPGGGEGRGHRRLEPAGGLEDDPLGGQPRHAGEEGRDAGRVVGVAGGRPVGPGVEVEVAFGNVDPHEACGRHGVAPVHPFGPALRIRFGSTRLFGLRGCESRGVVHAPGRDLTPKGHSAYPTTLRFTKHTRGDRTYCEGAVAPPGLRSIFASVPGVALRSTPGYHRSPLRG